MSYILPPLKSLPAFAAVAHHLSFSRAAEALSVTHSAISQSIKQLENFLEVQLFIRDKSNVSLTEEGRYFYEKISESLRTVDKATRRLKRTQSTSMITFNLLTALSTRWLIARLPNFQMQFPHIDLRLSTLGREVDFRYDDVDALIDCADSVDSQLYSEKLFDDQLILVASPQLTTAFDQPIESILKQHKAIYIEHPLRRNDWEDWCEAVQIDEPPLENRVYFQNSNQAILAANTGMGVLVSHNIFLVDDLSSGQLKPIYGSTIKTGKHYYFVTTKYNIKKQRIKELCQWIVEEAQQSRIQFNEVMSAED